MMPVIVKESLSKGFYAKCKQGNAQNQQRHATRIQRATIKKRGDQRSVSIMYAASLLQSFLQMVQLYS